MSAKPSRWRLWLGAARQEATWLGLAMIALIWGSVAYHLDVERMRARQAAVQNTGNLARSFEEYTVRSIKEVDKSLLLLRTAFEKNPEEFDLAAFTASPYFLNDLTLQVAMIGATGQMLSTNIGAVTASVDLSDREHFRVHATGTEDVLFISRPVLGRASGKWSVQLTRRLRRPDGGFAGVIVASLDPAHLARFYESVDVGTDGAITLIGRDGVVRARGGPGSALGRDVSNTALMREMRVAPNGWTQSLSTIDGLDRLVSWREVRGFPLFVTVSVPEREIYAAVTVKERELRLSAAGMTLLIGCAIVLSSRHRIRLTRARGALAESERHASQKSAELEATLANMSQGIMMVDANRTVAVINRRAVDLLGLPAAFLHSRPRFDEILRWQWENGEFDSEGTALDEKTLAFIRTGGIAAEYQVYERARPDGTVLEIRSIPLAGGGVVRTYTDITERVLAQEALARARDEAEAASRARTSFLAMMSHEMRTPLNGVIGMANLLIDTPLDDEQSRYVSTLRASGEHLLMIISDILDLSKLEADRLELEDIAFDLEDTVGTVLEIVAPAAREKSLFLVAQIAPDVPRRVRGDPAVLRQVLLNLVGNAVKFTPAGQVEVRVARGPEAEDGRLHISFEVHDTGIGIAADKLSALFHEFSQLDGSISRRFGGTGLGLAISRRLVERMDGRVSVDSELGKGSIFRCFVVLAPIEDEPSAPLLQDLRVLIISTDSYVRPALASMLEAAGAAAAQATGLHEAEAALDQVKPQTVLIDESLGDGLAACINSVQARGGPVPPRIVLLTGIIQRNVHAPARPAGIDRTVAWPVTGSVLAGAVAGAAGPALLPVVEDESAGSSGLRILLAEDNRTNRLVVGTILEKLGHTVHTVEDGRAAVEAVQRDRYDLVLMDVMMPEMDGYAACRAIRALPGAVSRLPIVALTANALPEDEAAAKAAGMSDFATKPITRARLQQIVARACPAGERPSTALPQGPGAMDRATLDRFVAEMGTDMAQEIIAVFLRDTRSRLAAMPDLLGDRNRLSREAHSLKSAAATLGLNGLAAGAARIEREANSLGPVELTEALKGLAASFEAGSVDLTAETSRNLRRSA